jgi:hypothetical protein
MNGHQLDYLDTLMHIMCIRASLPEANGKEIRNEIEASFDEDGDLRHHTFVKLAEKGLYNAAQIAKDTPLYEIGFDEPKVIKLTMEWHDPDRYLSGGCPLEDVVRDEASNIVDGGWVDNGIGHYEYGGCPGYHTQIDYEYSINEIEIEWFENFAELMTDEELAEHLATIADEGASVSIKDGDDTAYLKVTDVKVTSITPVTKTYSGKVDGEWKIVETRKLYKYWFIATVGE